MSLAVVQFRGTPLSPEINRRRSVELIRDAAGRGARVIVLPELAISGYVLDGPSLLAAAEPWDGDTLAAWHGVARELGVVVAGGFCERDGESLYNSALLVGPEGLLLHYRKLHLFDREKLIFSPGDRGLAVADTPFGRIGLCVCYDLRFVEVLRVLALQGAGVVAVPTAWVGGFDPVQRDAEGLIGQARGAAVQANLNQIYLACASQPGSAGDIRFLGSSMIVDPFGSIEAGPLDDMEERTAFAPLDPARLQAAQQRSALILPRADRRTDVYGLHAGGTVY